MKKAVIILMGLFLTGCVQENEFDAELVTTKIVSISYDSQDNLIKVNDSEWLISVDWDTYLDTYSWSPANEYLGVHYDGESKELIVVSSAYEITGAVVEDIYTDWYIVEGVLHIQVPTIQEYMYNTDLFYFKIKTESLKQ